MMEVLSLIDDYLAARRDKGHYELKEIRKRDYITMVGQIEISRRYYWDKHKKKWVYLESAEQQINL